MFNDDIVFPTARLIEPMVRFMDCPRPLVFRFFCAVLCNWFLLHYHVYCSNLDKTI